MRRAPVLALVLAACTSVTAARAQYTPTPAPTAPGPPGYAPAPAAAYPPPTGAYPPPTGAPGVAPAPTPPPQPSENELVLTESTASIEVAVVGGGTRESNTDNAMSALGYVSDQQILGGDISLTLRTLPWLWFGVRTGFRVRTWERGAGRSAGAIGNDLLGLAQARFRFARTFDFVIHIGAGLGHVAWQIEDGVTSGVAPRTSVGIQLGMTIFLGLRVFARLAWDWFRWSNADETDLDVELSAFTGAGGVEVRL